MNSRPHPDAPALSLRDVTKTFPSRGGTVHAVRGITLDVRRGEVLALLGPNGAGKTTLLDMVLGFTAPTSGTVEVLGMNAESAVRAGHISAVLQTGGLLPDLTVRHTVAMIAKVQAHPLPVEETLRRAGALEFADRRVSKCSGGQQQRLRFALALLTDPDILILDEPTAGMDVTARREFWATMHERAAEGRTVIFATHYLEEAQDFAERIVLVADGRIVADGPVAEIQSTIATKTIRFTPPADFSADAALAVVSATLGRPIDGRHSVDQGRHTIVTADADPVALHLLGTVGATDVDITPAGLDEAFIALTSREGN
ncbi:ABC transporter ATP-binding protein [Microbacterium gorillae]|uniref:ABC transporter ATP-binding protein n=1 Tax=Microbacterium gorillae TaxID=1231063 RepID=UPI00058C72EA|nr:ABC transporter ATP-binding protein [Microbacterium gorillae]